MIGAIIGDLAAWTWENDHERFYPLLISEKAVLSEYGLSVLATSDALDYNPHLMTRSCVSLMGQRSGLTSKTIITITVPCPLVSL